MVEVATGGSTDEQLPMVLKVRIFRILFLRVIIELLAFKVVVIVVVDVVVVVVGIVVVFLLLFLPDDSLSFFQTIVPNSADDDTVA